MIEGLSETNTALALACIKLLTNEIDEMIRFLESENTSEGFRQAEKPKEEDESTATAKTKLERASLLLGKGSRLHVSMLSGQLAEVLILLVQRSNMAILRVILPYIEGMLEDKGNPVPKVVLFQVLKNQVASNSDYTTRGFVLEWYLNLMEKLVKEGVVKSNYQYEIPKPTPRAKNITDQHIPSKL